MSTVEETLPARPEFEDPLARRLAEWVRLAEALRGEGLPLPIQQVRELVERLRARGEAVRAEQTVARAERLLERASRDWALLRELLRRIDELKQLATRTGLDLTELDAKIGNPRELLRGARLSEGLLEQAMAVGSKALAVLNDVMPKFLVTQSQVLGRSIKLARDRGEDVTESSDRLAQFVRSLRAGQLRGTALAFLELRKSVAQIPREPTVPMMPRDEEEEILREARNLARRLNRMKTRARDATSAARLMSQVKAALAEDRRYSTPEEEIDELWNEVDRLSRERSEARSELPAEPRLDPEKVPELDPNQIPAELLEAATEPLDPPEESPRRHRRLPP
jgi:uncharacterized coiled-coil DUF342 family protein